NGESGTIRQRQIKANRISSNAGNDRLSNIVYEYTKKRKICKHCGLANYEAANDDSRMTQSNTNVYYALCIPEEEDIPIKSNVQRQPKNYSYTDATKGQGLNGNESKNGPKKRANRKKIKEKITMIKGCRTRNLIILIKLYQDQAPLDKAVESWTKCVVEAGEAIIGVKTIWKGTEKDRQYLQPNIVPIPKPNRDHSICENHRHIALLSGVGKEL
ncbi:hypothetical protein RFI_36041, partial [Reticulomyxa filosa]